MTSLDTKFIDQPSALVKSFWGYSITQTTDWQPMGKMTLTPEYVRSTKRQTLVVKAMKTNKTKIHRERQNVGS